jgi:hypothetical protein
MMEQHFAPQVLIMMKQHFTPQLYIAMKQHFAFELPNHQLSLVSFF